MTPDYPIIPDTLESGEPSPPGRFRRRNLLAGLATVAVLAAAATGVAMATTSPTPAPSGTATPNQKQEGPPGVRQHQMGGGLRGGPGFGGPGIGGPGIGGALHGEFVVAKQGGGYQTVVVQRGVVTAVSATTITVRSTDKFSATYGVNADALVNAARDGIASIKKGDEVNVLAQQKSGNDSAVQISDFTRMKGLDDRFGPGHDRGVPTPAPSTSGSASTSSFGV